MTATGLGRATSYDPARCDLCGSSAATVVLDLPPPAMTSDGRMVAEGLHKLECAGCGLVRNGRGIDEQRLAAHYESYQLGLAAAAGEPLFFTHQGVKPRSEVIFEWIASSVAAVTSVVPASVLEIGCGEGSLLARLAQAWPSSRVAGLDLSEASVAMATSRGLAAARGTYRDVQGRYDLIYSFAVIEHVPSPADFMARLRDHLSPAGLLLVAQPCQDRGSNDVFFVDHLHHFSSRHLSDYGRRAGLIERLATVGHPLIPDFSLHLFSRQGEAAIPVPPGPPQDIRQVIAKWRAAFDRLDRWLDDTRGRPLAVWGLGQTFQMLRTYSRLRELSITIGIDDNAARFAGAQLAFPVSSLEAAALDDPRPVRVLLTFAPGPAAAARLRARGLDWFSPLEESPT